MTALVEIGPSSGRSKPKITIRCGYADRSFVQRIPGRRWDPDQNAWTLPLSMSSCLALRTEFGDRLEIGPELRQWAQTEACWRAEVQEMSADLTGEGLERPGSLLKGYQELGVKFLLTARRALLGDEQGTGKTVMTITGITDRLLFPALIVCPKSVIPTWVREFEKWTTKETLPKIAIASGGKAKQAKAFLAAQAGEVDIVITNYEALKGHTNSVAYGTTPLTEAEKTPGEANSVPWEVIVVDEAHRLRNPKSGTTRAVKGVAKDVPYRWALTGTPIESTPDELWSILNFLDPDEFPAKTRFVERYLDTVPTYGGAGYTVTGLNPRYEPELRKLLLPRMIRRTKALVLPQLPPKVRSARYVDLSPKERKAYNAMRDSWLTELDDGNDLIAFDPMVQMARLIQLANSPMVQDPTDQTKLVPVEKSSKLDLLDDTLADFEDESVVVWFVHRGLLDLYHQRLAKRGTPFVAIHGGVDLDGRKRAEMLFQSGQVKLILLTMAAGSEGLTLTTAGTAIYVERSWSSLKDSQSQDRIHRHGSEIHEQINLIDLVTTNTAEEAVIGALSGKSERIEDVLRDKDLIKETIK